LATLYALAGLCAAAVAVTLAAERRGSRTAAWIAKPVASTTFLVAAVHWGALETAYGRLVLAALALSWLGDVLLIPKARAYFAAGLAAFLLAHLAFAAAFVHRGLDSGAVVTATAVMAVGAALILRWLWTHLGGALRIAVVLYVLAIGAMAVTAFGATAAGGGPALLVGAVAFVVSDLAVARNRFVAPGLINRVWGLPLYYLAQFLLASTVR
jgi:uncharacterized membrane protein YhhN